MGKVNGNSKWSKSVSQAMEENRQNRQSQKTSVTVNWKVENGNGQVQMTTSDGTWNGTTTAWVDKAVARMVTDAKA